MVTYEDLSLDTEKELLRMLTELHIKVGESLIRQAVENQSFGKKRLALTSLDDTKNAIF